MKRNKCPATGKTIFENQQVANEAIIKIKNHNKINFINKRRNGKSNQKRSYFCSYCKGFHLTSLEKFEIKKRKPNDKEINKIKFLNSFDVMKWKENSLPFKKINE